jgi:hypothetical protein
MDFDFGSQSIREALVARLEENPARGSSLNCLRLGISLSEADKNNIVLECTTESNTYVSSTNSYSIPIIYLDTTRKNFEARPSFYFRISGR